MGNRIQIKYEDIVNDANFLRAGKNTLRNGVRFKKEGALWKRAQEKHINKLKKMLMNQTYKHGKYQPFTVYEPQKRTILAANLTDRVLHHAVFRSVNSAVRNTTKPMKRMYFSIISGYKLGMHMPLKQILSH